MSDIDNTVIELEKGNVIVYPTETSYALGADATSSRAVAKVFEIKKRDSGKPLSIIVSSLKMIEQYAIVDEKAEKLIKKFMPGPLTLIVPVKPGMFPANLCKDSIGFRISSNPIAQQLCKKFGKPITATSANLSGSEPIYKIIEIRRQFKGLHIVNAGDLAESPASTIYCNIRHKVLRQGPISENEIMTALREQ